MTYIVKVSSIKTDAGIKFKGDVISELDFNNKAVFQDLVDKKLIVKESKTTKQKES